MIPVPEGFSENLVEFTRNEFDLTYDEVRTIVKYNQVCLPNDVCFDLDDIENVCCPF